jgi:hypothetical protein
MLGAIVGARSPTQADGWLAAAPLVLNDADLNEIAAAIGRTNQARGLPGRGSFYGGGGADG